MKICKNCKAEMGDDDVYCMYCGTKLDEAPIDTLDPSKIDPFADDIAVNNQTEQPRNGESVGQAAGFVQRAKSFESKHNIILNLVLMACAIVILFVSLFAPIKIVNYSTTGIFGGKGSEVTKYYAETDQSNFQVIGSVFYFNASDKQENALAEQYAEMARKYEKKYNEWVKKHPKASSQDRANASVEISTECASEMNLFGYIFASVKSEDMSEGTFLSVLVSAIIAIVISVLSIATAILSLVYIIKSILNIVNKKPQTQLYKYLSTVLGLSVSCIALMCCAPMLKAGGGMFAVALFTAIAYLVVAVVGAFIGKTDKAVIIKRASIAVVSMIAFFILCTNVFAFVYSSVSIGSNYTVTTYVPSGSGIYNFIRSFGGGDGSDEAFMSSVVCMVMSVIIALLFVPYVGNVMHRSLNRLAYGFDKKSSVTALAIAAAVFAIITIAVGFSSDTITEQIFKLYEAPVTNASEQWLVRAQVWVSMILMIVVAVFNRVFLPNDEVNSEVRIKN